MDRYNLRHKTKISTSVLGSLFAKISACICIYLWLFSLCLSVPAQVRPVNDYGALGLAQLLKRLNTTASVMMIGAHPDDEDSALIAYLARGESARTAYLSLTRGDGGQNIIGPELGEALGVLRTEELLQARRLDGAEQYFTRAYDYGFSKTLAEAKSKWPEDVIKCDVVRAIRLFRPLVVISRFTGTPADGHGQHQYAGYISPIAVKAAADPQQCTDAGTPWQVLKFYVEQSFSDTAQPTLKINTGQYDPILGRSYFEIAMEGRSMHRSQGEGRLEFHGDIFSGLNLVGAAKGLQEKRIFDGIDTSLTGLSKLFPSTNPLADAIDSALFAAQQSAQQALRDFDLGDPTKIIPLLIKGRTALDRLAVSPDARPKYNSLTVVYRQSLLFSQAIKQAVGVQIDALSNADTVAPGDMFSVTCNTFYPGESKIKVKGVSLAVPSGWFSERTNGPNGPSPNPRREVPRESSYFAISVPKDAQSTQPYWLVAQRDGDLYKWPNAESATLPFEPQPLKAVVKAEIDGSEVVFEQPVQFRYADPARGELRRNVDIVPPVSISLDKPVIVIKRGVAMVHRTVSVRITNNTGKRLHVRLGVLKPGFQTVETKLVMPEFDLDAHGVTTTELGVDVIGEMHSPPFSIGVSAQVDDRTYLNDMHLVAYPHIQSHRFYTRAATKVVLVDLVTEPVKIGYIMGSGDEIPEAIRQMGMSVSLLDEKDLASGDLSRFDTIVVGIRASETRPDMMANKQRLMDYVNAGGNLIMQYQRGNFAQSGLTPYPVDTNDKQGTTAGSVARVVDENAPVKILDPANPIFNFPNKITDEDFKGWVQERNAYNLVTFDPKYMPLLESHDAGEQENKGGLVIAKVGKGNWVYCSYSFFRQLPAGVPGAYRLFANLLSLKTEKK